MKGHVDSGGRALVAIAIKPSPSAVPTALDAWIDTGFTGELVVPQNMISALGLPQSGSVGAQLADGSTLVMTTYTCHIDWFGKERQIEVVANNGQFPLLGVGLLLDHKLTVDYPLQTLAIE